jgi:hypothetical protein
MPQARRSEGLEVHDRCDHRLGIAPPFILHEGSFLLMHSAVCLSVSFTLIL